MMWGAGSILCSCHIILKKEKIHEQVGGDMEKAACLGRVGGQVGVKEGY